MLARLSEKMREKLAERIALARLERMKADPGLDGIHARAMLELHRREKESAGMPPSEDRIRHAVERGVAAARATVAREIGGDVAPDDPFWSDGHEQSFLAEAARIAIGGEDFAVPNPKDREVKASDISTGSYQVGHRAMTSYVEEVSNALRLDYAALPGATERLGLVFVRYASQEIDRLDSQPEPRRP